MTQYTKPEAGEPCVLQIGGRKVELLFTLRVLKQLDADHKISILKGGGLGTMMQDPDMLATVLYYGLKTKQPELTAEWVEENVDASMLLDMSPMIVRAVTGQWPDMEKLMASLPNGNRPAAKSEAGSTSGQLAGTTSDVVM